MKITFDDILELLPETPIAKLAEDLPAKIAYGLSDQRWARLKDWIPIVESLPDFGELDYDLNAHDLGIGKNAQISEEQRAQLKATLKEFMPWRKGPFSFLGIDVDTEWRSDWKWERVLPHISPLKYRNVLDVGCGSGYHCWRMAGEGANMVVGVEPSPLSNMQYWVTRHFLSGKNVGEKNVAERKVGESNSGANNVFMLPLTLEEVPPNIQGFDTVFSMGVLYHRRSPIDHLYQLKGCMKQGSELVLETLIVDAPEGTNPKGYSLVPDDRYAQMRNVWFLPTVETMVQWMERVGFKDIKVVDVNQTSLEEQRSTEWMSYQSLSNFLDPEDRTKTIEGYQAPTRATFIATL